MSIRYTDEFLISELHRFVKEEGFIPNAQHMKRKYGYPSYIAYFNHFGTWNKALEIAGLKINNKHHGGTLDGTETCSICGCYRKERQYWIYHDGVRYCMKHGHSDNGGSPDYIKKELNPKSPVGKAIVSQRVVANTLKIPFKYDCNCSEGFNASVDLYDKGRYNYINVKDSTLYNSNYWSFHFSQKEIPNTYILVGFDKERKHILRVWICKPTDKLVYNKKGIGITNDIYTGLKRAKPYEVDAKPYDDMLHQMSEKRKETNGEGCILSNNDLIGDIK